MIAAVRTLRTFVFRALQKQHFFAFAAHVLLRQSGRRKFSHSRGLLQLKPKTLLRCMSFGFERRGTKPPVAVAAKLVLCSCKYSLNYCRLRSVVSAERSDGKARQYNVLHRLTYMLRETKPVIQNGQLGVQIGENAPSKPIAIMASSETKRALLASVEWGGTFCSDRNQTIF